MGRKVRSFLTAFLQRTKTKTVFPCFDGIPFFVYSTIISSR
ncbi:hypothetical protein HMPREF9064_0281 [Aggregatibacter segnis ATCC 33393]|uniref:Uncharacterized protein n=1 Tax=Aggregatibacter segnis ATCC 33393 TaxID=888057 RepID=E6KVU9_9PAST|nr:hypothetical protein HMPREF9064_0281 [Aggregatibacter segnis ATCC 33393]